MSGLVMDKEVPQYARLLVYQGSFMFSLLYEQIELISYENRLVTLYTIKGERYQINRKLNELEELLPKSDFFRINRSCIISYWSVSSVEVYFNGRLIVKTTSNRKDQLIVSSSKMTAFKLWLGC